MVVGPRGELGTIMWYYKFPLIFGINDRDYLSYEWVDRCLFLENAVHNMDTCRSGTLVLLEPRVGIGKGTPKAKQRSGRQGFYHLH